MSSILLKVVRIYKSQFKCNYLKKEKLFVNFLFDFWILHQILNILKEKMIVIANVFPILQTVKVSVRPLSKKRCVRTRFYNQDVKASKMLWKSPSEIFCHFFIIVREVDLENVSAVLGESVGVFVNTFTADGKYPVQGCANLSLPIHMQLCEKRKMFS